MQDDNGKIGVILLSLGTPDSPDFKGVRRFLSEFLSDKNIIDMNRALWLPLLHGVILNARPFKSSKAYAKVWDYERGESPLRTISREQGYRLGEEFADDENVIVDWAFRYGTPSIQETMMPMIEAGCDRIFLMALYPQYSNTTVGTAYEKAVKVASYLKSPPEIRTGSSYYNHPKYIAAMKDSIEDQLKCIPWEPDVILASYHSIPLRYVEQGDPYRDHCEETHRLLKEALTHRGDQLQMSYQSRVGYQQWLPPYSKDKVKELAENGVRDLVVVAPAFAQDCLETLEEIKMELCEEFLRAGGHNFQYVPCLNVRDDHIGLIKEIVEENIQDWRDEFKL